jgi:amidohydrolase
MKRQFLSAVAVLALAACSPSVDQTTEETSSADGSVSTENVAFVPVPGDDSLREAITADYAEYLQPLYEHFHANPELSFREFETAARLATELREIGFEVTEGVGETGIVAVMTNGEGTTLMLRADMDGLPVEEDTGVAYASTVRGLNQLDQEQPVMHACAHDTHMTTLVGTARRLAAQRDDWSGTLVLVGQPAEEVGLGARAMIADGLFERFPVPDFNVSFHTFSAVPTGQITYVPGFAMANVDTVDIYVHGRGGHGAYPHTTKDPIYLASEIVVALQGLVSRELNPLEPGVITVGAFNAGLKHNIISDEAHLQLTVRSYTDEVREHLLTGIQRVAASQAASYGMRPDEYPTIEIEETYTPALYNNPALAERAVATMRERFGTDAVAQSTPIMGGEDFSQYHRTEHNIPTFMFWVGGTTQERLTSFTDQGLTPPSNHSPFFAPDDPQSTIIQATEAMTAVALDILAAG